MLDILKKISPLLLFTMGLNPLFANPPLYVPQGGYVQPGRYAPYGGSNGYYSGYGNQCMIPCEDYDDCCNPVDVCCYPSGCGTFFVSGEYLYWRASEEGVEFTNCVTTSTVTSGVLSLVTEETDAHAGFNWNSGFRIGAGYVFPNSCWNIAAYWARYFGSARQDDAPPGDTGKWHLKYNVEDLIIERPFFIYPCTTLIPYLGVRFAQISQTLETMQVTTGVLVSERQDKQKFWGIGPEIGFEADYMLPWGVSIYGGLGASVLYGHTNVTVDDFTNFISDTVQIFGKRKVVNTQLVFDASIGFRWAQCICDHIVEIGVGLEHQRFFNHNFLDEEGYGDLSLSGLTVSLGVDL